MFNYGLHAFHAPLVNIPAMYEHFNGRKLPGAEGSDFIKRLDDVLAGAEREQTEAETVGQTNAPAATELSRMATEIPAASDDETAPARLSAEEANGRLCGLWVSSENLSDYTAYHHLRLNENGSALFRFCGRGGVVSDKYEAEARSTWELTDDGQTVRVTVERPDRWNLYVYPPDFEDACTETKDFSLRQSSDGGLKMREETDGAPPQIYHRVGPPSSSPPGAA